MEARKNESLRNPDFPSFSNCMLLGSLIASANLGGSFIAYAYNYIIKQH